VQPAWAGTGALPGTETAHARNCVIVFSYFNIVCSRTNPEIKTSSSRKTTGTWHKYTIKIRKTPNNKNISATTALLAPARGGNEVHPQMTMEKLSVT
jgi:hypothetical protein